MRAGVPPYPSRAGDDASVPRVERIEAVQREDGLAGRQDRGVDSIPLTWMPGVISDPATLTHHRRRLAAGSVDYQLAPVGWGGHGRLERPADRGRDQVGPCS